MQKKLEIQASSLEEATNVAVSKLHVSEDKLFLNEIGENQYEKKYTYFSYGEIYNFCVNTAKNLHAQSEDLIVEDTYNNINFKRKKRDSLLKMLLSLYHEI